MVVSFGARTSTRETGGENPWDSQHEAFDYVVDEIEGRVPESLRGVLYRIGPGRFEVGGHPMTHIFDGDGMVSRLEISPDRIHYRNRYVRTKAFRRANETQSPPKGFNTQRVGGPLANVLRFPENLSNTSVLVHDDVLYTLWEGGRPHRLDAETLETHGSESFGGALKRIGAFSAHPKVDPHTGDVFNFGLDFFPQPLIRCYRLDRSKRLHNVGTIPIPKLGFVHDFALTDRHLVFVLGPLVVHRPIPVALGLRPFGEALSYRPELGTTIVLLPRDGGRPIRLEYESLFMFHVANAYEDGHETVVDIVAHDPSGGWATWNNYLCNFRENAGPAFGGRLTRLRINRRTTGVRRELLNDRGCEFPQLDPEIYRELLRRLDCVGPEVVYIDDFAENLPPAAALGMTTIEFTGPRELRETLAGLGVEVSP
ncbi:dioxygenase [Gordonia paraffinivorans]|uniref:carotenoid oxygenase family protein n=2 Tax=Gordonia paraffinivorans TaxID=175628 RepID=UPI001C92CB9E|nr:carotenoid oxygenase family protein [Gordonia paraffinivorans]MBY4574940.1 dioxygenase [Gordonia paraffinivorans]